MLKIALLFLLWLLLCGLVVLFVSCATYRERKLREKQEEEDEILNTPFMLW